ncbi:MAG: YncE family protein [Methanoregulaceae archaeon]|nr:YncE family protein [Methanoregulaceae archaeon]
MSTNASMHRLVVEVRWSRRSVLSVLAALVIAAALMWATAALARSTANPAAPSSALAALTVVSYQGRVSVNGQPFNGTGYFKFAIVNAGGTAAYWSNDGTGLATAPFTPTQAVALNVSNGLFNVLLGDTTLAGMAQPMKPNVFAAPDRVLRVWFDDDTHGWQRLTPDVQVASAPYALNAEFARTSPNLQRIAMLRWYTAVSITQAFSVGVNPAGIAFDGENIWVTNAGSDNVNVLRAYDGYHVMTPTAMSDPIGIAFDGANMWVVNNGSGTVSVLRSADGYRVVTPTVNSQAANIAFDGENMWVVSYGYVQVLRASDGALLRSVPLAYTAHNIAFDGANMWVVNNGSGTVSVLRASDYTPVATYTVGVNPTGIAFDGANMWVTNKGSGSVSVLRASDGYHVMTPTVSAGSGNIAFDGTNMWVPDDFFGTVSVLRASDGALVTTAPIGFGVHTIAFDGAFMWVTNADDETVSKR